MSTVGILGLGLIGGSFAKAYHAAGWTVLAADRDAAILSFAQMSGAVDGTLGAENAAQCDLILACICPEAAIAELTGLAPHIGEKPVVIDCCGTKRVVCEALFPVAEQYGFTYLGGHPMAGSHHSGFKYARENLYHNAPMVLVPPSFDDIALLQRVKELLAPAGFGHISVTTAQAHDEMIAFTSQMPHLISNAYIKSPTAQEHMGFSAGSYKDLTRVAKLNEDMWTELFLENPDNLADEIDTLIENLQEYSWAIRENDSETLRQLLKDGREKKAIIDGEIF